MSLEVDPASRLLYAKLPPLILSEKLTLVIHLLEDLFGENDMAVLIVVITIFFRVLDLGGIVRHKYYIHFKE